MVRLTKNGQHFLLITILLTPIGMGLANAVTQDKTTSVVIEGNHPPLNMIKIKTELGMTPASARSIAKKMLKEYDWNTKKQWNCLNWMWGKEAAWRYDAVSPTKDHGIPQRNMPNHTKAERDAFLNNPKEQIRWGLSYIQHRYGSPCDAKRFWIKNRWY